MVQQIGRQDAVATDHDGPREHRREGHRPSHGPHVVQQQQNEPQLGHRGDPQLGGERLDPELPVSCAFINCERTFALTYANVFLNN
jgi:hypothetical protein